MIYVIGIIVFLLILGIIVVVHECGHLIVAKRNGIYCHEFSIGMGPKIVQFYKDKSGTVYNLRAVPLGGYVSIAGEDTGLEADENVPQDQKFDNKGKWVRFKVLVAGATMNFILGILIYALIGFFSGVPVDNTTQVNVVNGGILDQAGVADGSYIKSVNGEEVDSYSQIVSILQEGEEKAKEAGKEVDDTTYTIDYADGEDSSLETVDVQKDPDGKIGISVAYQRFHLLKSIGHGFYMVGYVIFATIASIWLLLTGQAGVTEIAGPVGMATATTGIAQLGISALLSWMAFLSLAVGAMNLLPIPALDGGRILFIGIEAIIGRPVNPKIETFLNNLIFFGLIALMIFVTVSDVIQTPDRIDSMNNALGTEEKADADSNNP